MSLDFHIAETETFSRSIAQPEYNKVYEKIRNYVYPQLKSSPYFGKNSRRSKGEWKYTYRYRIGACRLFYTIDARKLMVFVLALNDAMLLADTAHSALPPVIRSNSGDMPLDYSAGRGMEFQEISSSTISSGTVAALDN